MRVMAHMRDEMFEWEELGSAYAYLARRFAKGAPLDDLEVESRLTEILGADWYEVLVTRQEQGGKIGDYTKRVLFSYRARRQAQYLAELAERAADLVGKHEEQAHEIADSAIGKLATIHTTQGDLEKPVSREEITARAIARLTSHTKNAGVAWPYGKLQDQMGNLLPGDVVAVAGYSGSGKS